MKKTPINLNAAIFGKSLGLFFFCLPAFLSANPIVTSELPEEVLEEGATFPQIFSLVGVLIITQVAVVACIWGICWLARKNKRNLKSQSDACQNDLSSAESKSEGRIE